MVTALWTKNDILKLNSVIFKKPVKALMIHFSSIWKSSAMRPLRYDFIGYK